MDEVYYQFHVKDGNMGDCVGHQKYLETLNNDPKIKKVDRGIYRSDELDVFLHHIPHRSQWCRWEIRIFHVDIRFQAGRKFKEKELVYSFGEIKKINLSESMDSGSYTEMCIYDTRDFYRKKDPESKKLMKLLESDPTIYRVAPGVYRGSGLHSFARIHQSRRWRMEVVEKYNGKPVKHVWAKRHMFEDWDTRFSKPGHRSWKTFITDYIKTYQRSNALTVLIIPFWFAFFKITCWMEHDQFEARRTTLFYDPYPGLGLLIIFGNIAFFIGSYYAFFNVIVGPLWDLINAYKYNEEYDPKYN